jgi:hypothetical protein
MILMADKGGIGGGKIIKGKERQQGWGGIEGLKVWRNLYGSEWARRGDVVSSGAAVRCFLSRCPTAVMAVIGSCCCAAVLPCCRAVVLPCRRVIVLLSCFAIAPINLICRR